MVEAAIAAGYWGVVRAYLVQFHHIPTAEAEQRVAELWTRLARLDPSRDSSKAEMPPIDDLIYHEEPWYIACNLADCNKPLDPHRMAYEQILKQNHLA